MLFFTRTMLPASALAAMLSTAQAQTATGSEHEGHHPEGAAPAAQSSTTVMPARDRRTVPARWSALGPVTRARGFGLGGYIAGDHTDPTGAMGGGMCSAAGEAKPANWISARRVRAG